MRPIVFIKALVAANAAAICAAQTGAANTPLTLNGPTAGAVWPNSYATAAQTVATLDGQRRVLITSAGNDSGITFKVSGTNDNGTPINCVVTGGNASAVATPLDFLTVTSVVPSGGTASTVQVGTNTTGSTEWAYLDRYVTPMQLGLAYELVSGAQTVTIEYTYDNWLLLEGLQPKAANAAPTPIAVPFSLTTLTGISSNTDMSGAVPTAAPSTMWRGVRLTITAGTGTGQLTVFQAGITQN